MKNGKVIIVLLLILLVVPLIVFRFSNTSNIVKYKDFESYEQYYTIIAKELLLSFQQNSFDDRLFLSIDDERKCLFYDNGERVQLSVESSCSLDEIINAEMNFDYIVVGDTYITFMKDAEGYGILYSVDKVKPKGFWKYFDDEVNIVKLSDCWFELNLM